MNRFDNQDTTLFAGGMKMVPEKIVIVEDSKMFHKMYDLVFLGWRQKGTVVLHAYDGSEGLALVAANEDAEIILLDAIMPGMNGFELLKMIRNMPKLNLAKVVMISSDRKEEDIRKAYDLGAQAYLTKPIVPFDLLTVLTRLHGYKDRVWCEVPWPAPQIKAH